jgi:hypothetical protein
MKCLTRNCKNRAALRRYRNRKIPFKGGKCHKCHQRGWREKNKFKSAYATLRDHAKARGIPFAIPFWYFEHFAKMSNYIDEKGPFKHCLTIDRKDNLRGYVAGNIQALTRESNSRKRMRQDEIRTASGFSWKDQ